jgi:hypothetical protein
LCKYLLPPCGFFNFFIINQNSWKIIKEFDIIQMTIHYVLGAGRLLVLL